MRRALAVLVMLLIFLTPFLWLNEATARRDGYSGSSRGLRNQDTPSQSSPSNRWSFGESAPPPSSFSSGRSGRSRPGWVTRIAGLIAGGVLGSLMFGGPWHGGLSLLDVIVLSVLIYLMFRGLSEGSVDRVGLVSSPNGSSGTHAEVTRSLPRMRFGVPTANGTPPRGATRIHEIEPDFDARRFGEMVVAAFAKLQAAWTARDVSLIGELLTPGMRAFFERDCHRMRADGQINRFERIRIERAQIIDAWQERGHDHVTVHLGGTAIDYTTDERGIILDGNPAEPAPFEEALTFMRPTGSARWRLSAIRQPA